MRTLEKLSLLWPMDVIRKQIDTLREAFSADINKPFELKPDFPFGSPASQLLETPVTPSSHIRSQLRASPTSQPQQFGHGTDDQTSTSFVSAAQIGPNSLSHHHSASYPLSDSPTVAATNPQMQPWNPVPIFELVSNYLPVLTHLTGPGNSMVHSTHSRFQDRNNHLLYHHTLLHPSNLI